MGRVIFVAVVLILALIVGGPIMAMSSMASLMMGAGVVQAAAGASSSTSCDVPMAGAGESSTGVTMNRLSAEQIGRAHVVWQVAHELGFGDQGAVVGMVTLAQESTWGADPKTHKPDSNVDTGPFQQRALPGWYANGKTVEENTKILSDIRYAARTFFLGYKVTAADVAAARANGTQPAGPVGYVTPGLKSKTGWQNLPVGTAAQKVQVSAFPGHYAKHEGLARQLVAKFNAEAPPPVAADTTAVVNAGEAVNAPLCDPAGASGEVADCPDSGLAAERGLTPDATRVLRCAYQKWPNLTYGGVRADSMPYHPSGRAIDIMTPGVCGPVGQQIADWARSNAASLGVVDVIWCQQIWSVARANQGWRDMGDRGSNTQNHKDHVHITVAGNAAGSRPLPGAAEGEAAAQGQSGAVTVAPVDKYGLSARHNQRGSAWSSGFHTGLDFTPIPAGSNPPIKAAKAGTVKSVSSTGPYGNLVKVDHGGGIETYYAHMQTGTVKVKQGQKVAAGTVLGNMGATGNVRGTNPEHLHFEWRVNGSPVDPDRALAANGVNLAGSRA